MQRLLPLAVIPLAAAAFVAGRLSRPSAANAAPVDDHAHHAEATVLAPGAAPAQDATIAPGFGSSAARLKTSPRHMEWVKVPLAAGSPDSIAAFVVYPERRTNAPVVVVVHEIFGLSTWVRSVADQLAADGFIAIAPDLLSIERGGATTDSLPYDQARSLIQRVTPDKMNAMVAAVGSYGMSLPAARKVYGVVGYCWGGSAVFNHAVFNAPGMKAGVAYYGSAPPPERLGSVTAPILGLYGENDQRVNATIAPTDSAMKAIGKAYEYRIFPGAGHGFLRARDSVATDAPNAEQTNRTVGANILASGAAWPMTVAFFRKHLGG